MISSFFLTVYRFLLLARERHMSRYVNGALLRQDDSKLATLGMTREDIRRRDSAVYIF